MAYLGLCACVEEWTTAQAVFFTCQENVLCRDVKDILLSDVLMRTGSLVTANQESEIENCCCSTLKIDFIIFLHTNQRVFF